MFQYRILLNGFGYALFGVPPADLETTWRDETNVDGGSPLLGRRMVNSIEVCGVRNNVQF